MNSVTLASAATDGTGWKSTALAAGARFLDFYLNSPHPLPRVTRGSPQARGQQQRDPVRNLPHRAGVSEHDDRLGSLLVGYSGRGL
jgi:hypothetical protein